MLDLKEEMALKINENHEKSTLNRGGGGKFIVYQWLHQGFFLCLTRGKRRPHSIHSLKNDAFFKVLRFAPADRMSADSFDFYDFSTFSSFVFGATNFGFRTPICRCFVGSVSRASHMKNSVCCHFALHQRNGNDTKRFQR